LLSTIYVVVLPVLEFCLPFVCCVSFLPFTVSVRSTCTTTCHHHLQCNTAVSATCSFCHLRFCCVLVCTCRFRFYRFCRSVPPADYLPFLCTFLRSPPFVAVWVVRYVPRCVTVLHLPAGSAPACLLLGLPACLDYLLPFYLDTVRYVCYHSFLPGLHRSTLVRYLRAVLPPAAWITVHTVLPFTGSFVTTDFCPVRFVRSAFVSLPPFCLPCVRSCRFCGLVSAFSFTFVYHRCSLFCHHRYRYLLPFLPATVTGRSTRYVVTCVVLRCVTVLPLLRYVRSGLPPPFLLRYHLFCGHRYHFLPFRYGTLRFRLLITLRWSRSTVILFPPPFPFDTYILNTTVSRFSPCVLPFSTTTLPFYRSAVLPACRVSLLVTLRFVLPSAGSAPFPVHLPVPAAVPGFVLPLFVRLVVTVYVLGSACRSTTVLLPTTTFLLRSLMRYRFYRCSATTVLFVLPLRCSLPDLCVCFRCRLFTVTTTVLPACSPLIRSVVIFRLGAVLVLRSRCSRSAMQLCTAVACVSALCTVLPVHCLLGFYCGYLDACCVLPAFCARSAVSPATSFPPRFGCPACHRSTTLFVTGLPYLRLSAVTACHVLRYSCTVLPLFRYHVLFTVLAYRSGFSTAFYHLLPPARLLFTVLHRSADSCCVVVVRLIRLFVCSRSAFTFRYVYVTGVHICLLFTVTLFTGLPSLRFVCYVPPFTLHSTCSTLFCSRCSPFYISTCIRLFPDFCSLLFLHSLFGGTLFRCTLPLFCLFVPVLLRCSTC